MRPSRTTFFIALTTLLIFCRFLFLDIFPAGINHDEAEVLLSAKSYYLHGTDISGVHFPLSLFVTKTEAGLSGLPSVLLTPFMVFPTTQLSTRIPFVLLNLATGLVLALLIKRLTRNSRLALISWFVFLINPWSFAYSRATTEAPFGLFFILLALLCLFQNTSWRILYSLIFFILGFFSYFGAKPLIICFVPLTLLMHYFFVSKSAQQPKVYLIFTGLFIAFLILYFGAALSVPESTFTTRSPEITISHPERFQPEVILARTALIDNPLQTIFINKYTSLQTELIGKYFGWLSPDFLFLSGDPRATYRFGGSGTVYLIDAIFIILGLASLSGLKKSRTFIILISLMFVLGPVGSALSKVDTSYFFRSFLLMPGLVILIALGIEFLFKQMPKTLPLIIVMIIIYIFSYIGFLHFYFFQYPVIAEENQFFSQRILSSYLARTNYQPQLLLPSPLQISYQHQLFNQTNAPLKFITDCSDLNSTTDSVIIAASSSCPSLTSQFLTIQDQKDAGSIYRIYNDHLCTGITLSRYRQTKLVGDYDINHLTNSQFCQTWINHD